MGPAYMETHRLFIPTPGLPESLCWSGDALVDAVAGNIRYGLDGSVRDPSIGYSYHFDRAVASGDGRYTVIYEALGTAGLVLEGDQVLRQLQRHYYRADAYEAPMALLTRPDGRTLLAHCPESYCTLELEDVATGERLTRRSNPPEDVFHSRLQFSPDGRYLLSAGWLWQPVDAACVFDVRRALEDPSSLDRWDLMEGANRGIGVSAAAFAGPGTLVLTRDEDLFDLPEDAPRGGLCVYSLAERRILSAAPLQEPLGTLMAVGGRHVLGFYGHPKLVELATGRVVQRWEELDTGKQSGSIIRHLPKLPPLALDPARHRFAVGTQKGIEVIQLKTHKHG